MLLHLNSVFNIPQIFKKFEYNEVKKWYRKYVNIAGKN